MISECSSRRIKRHNLLKSHLITYFLHQIRLSFRIRYRPLFEPLNSDVDLTHCARLGDATLSALAPLRLLTAVKMPGCVRVSDDGLAVLAAAAAVAAAAASTTPLLPLNNTSSATANNAAVTAMPATRTPSILQLLSDTGPPAAAPSAASVMEPPRSAVPGAAGTAPAVHLCGSIPGSGSSNCVGSPVLYLHLDSCISVTDAGLSQLATLTSLTSLRLTRCAAITDAGVAALAALTRLCSLSLAHCPAVTQSGLLALSGITSLASLEF